MLAVALIPSIVLKFWLTVLMLVSESGVVAFKELMVVAARAAPAISAVRGRGFEPIRRAAARSQAIDDGFFTTE
jgi:hypothetical protein